MRQAAAALLAAAALAVQTASFATGAVEFSAAERRQIAAHGPWPPPLVRDAGNALAGRADAIALGRVLFFDARLSADGTLACAGCHAPGLAFTDGRARAVGRQPLDRNAPTLWNAVHQRWLGWDGAADSLWSQALRALTDVREMAADAAHLRRLLAADAALAARFARVLGQPPEALDDTALRVATAKLIGAYVGTLVSPRTPFDQFRDALLRHDAAALARYPAAAQRGLKLFIGRGRCALCHVGPLFTHGEFGDLGLPFFVRPGVVDPGRHGGIATLKASPFNRMGRWADRPVDPTSTAQVEATHRNFGEFKVPTLRHVADTAPYMHDGQLPTLAAVVRHYSELDVERLHADGERILEPLRLTAAEQADLVAFLKTLSPRRPGRH